jgi:hypothetical protein
MVFHFRQHREIVDMDQEQFTELIADAMPLKPGIKTTEFYMPTITAALGLLVSWGLLTTPLANDVATAIAAAVPATVGLIGAVVAAVGYIRGRVALKENRSALEPID